MIAPDAPAGPSFVVDLIGDLDATLGNILDATFADLRARGAKAIFITTKRIALTSTEGLRAVDRIVATARESGVVVGLDAGSRKMRAAFVEARIPIAHFTAPSTGATRTLLIAHHAVLKPALRSLAPVPLSA